MSCIVHGSQVAEALDAVLHLLGDDAALLEEVATLHDTVTHRVDLVEALQRTIFGVEQELEHKLHALFVVGHIMHHLLLGAVFERHFDEGIVETDTFSTTLGQHALVTHIIELVLDRAAAAIQY